MLTAQDTRGVVWLSTSEPVKYLETVRVVGRFFETMILIGECKVVRREYVVAFVQYVSLSATPKVDFRARLVR